MIGCKCQDLIRNRGERANIILTELSLLNLPFHYSNMLFAYDCRLGLAFLGAEPSTNQRFDYTVTLAEKLVDFPVQLIPRESHLFGNLIPPKK